MLPSATDHKKIKTVEMILKHCVVFSQNYWADFKLVYKNDHILFSCWTCHPNHPFARMERFIVLSLSLLLAFGLSSVFSRQHWAFGFLSFIIQTFYDTFAKTITACMCVQGCPTCIIRCFECLGKIALLVQSLIALAVLIGGMVELASAGEGVGSAIFWFFGNKLTSFIATTSVSVFLKYHMSRKKQMKPSREQMNKPAVKSKWESKTKPNCLLKCITCCLLGRSKKAPCTFWNIFWGPDAWPEDLPLLPPNYSYTFKIGCTRCCCCIKCHRVTLIEHVGDYDVEQDTWDPKAGPNTPNRTQHPTGDDANVFLPAEPTGNIQIAQPGMQVAQPAVQVAPSPQMVVEMQAAESMETQQPAQQTEPPMQMAQPPMLVAQLPMQVAQPPTQMA